MMYKPIMKFIFIVSIPISLAVISIEQFNNPTCSEFPIYTSSYQCKNITSLNVTNAEIIDIGPDFIKCPLINCLNLTNNSIKNIAKDGFRSLPNLTHLFLSNNNIRSSNGIYNFGTHQKLNVLVLNNMMSKENGQIIGKFGNYPNLEILSARNNNFKDLESEITLSDSYASLTKKIPFPKLKFLDLSENSIGYFTEELYEDYFQLSKRSNKVELQFINLLPNTIQFLDLHDNKFNTLYLREKGSNLLALNVNNNYFYHVVYKDELYDIIPHYFQYRTSLELAYLHNLRYLSISGNKLEHFGLNAFKDSNKLIYLNLSKNNLGNCMCFSSSRDMFANLHFLQVLDLSSNQFCNAPEISNENVNVLDLSRNQIKRIMSNNFKRTPKLTKLLLGGNQMYKIHVKAFTDLPALEELNLSNNNLNSLPEGWTEPIISLKYLDLSNNQFISVESLSLKNALPLIEVYLKENPLKNINTTKNLPQSVSDTKLKFCLEMPCLLS